ncbi:hypothetical protein CDAR_183861 [Caerostris darwini]|uniref:Ribosomal protein L2 n=1 Tax=Caerostris darwini TaxID=1538125 RepID=A0AAV4TWL3_9ARAC|nr:hypothetical protein CDAR_183861 [Caerostris darwini]
MFIRGQKSVRLPRNGAVLGDSTHSNKGPLSFRIKFSPPLPEVLPPTALLMHCLLHFESPPAVSRSDTNPFITSIIRSGVPERSSGLVGGRWILPQEKNRILISGRIINCVVILAEDELIRKRFVSCRGSHLPPPPRGTWAAKQRMGCYPPSGFGGRSKYRVQEYFGYPLRTDADSSQ